VTKIRTNSWSEIDSVSRGRSTDLFPQVIVNTSAREQSKPKDPGMNPLTFFHL